MFNYGGSIHYYLLLLCSALWNYFGKNILIHYICICFCTCLHSWHETGKWTSILVWKTARFGRTICPEDSLFLNKLFHLEEIYYGQFNCLTTSEFLTGDPFQLIHQFWCPSLHAFEWLHIFFSYGHSAPGEASLMWGQWDGHLSWLAGDAVFDAHRMGFILWVFRAHSWPCCQPAPDIPFCWTVLQPFPVYACAWHYSILAAESGFFFSVLILI